MGEFAPQPEGPGQIFPISLSLVVPVDQLQFSPRSLISKKSAPGADRQQLDDTPFDAAITYCDARSTSRSLMISQRAEGLLPDEAKGGGSNMPQK